MKTMVFLGLKKIKLAGKNYPFLRNFAEIGIKNKNMASNGHIWNSIYGHNLVSHT